jgi:C4-dicarboxylate-specific signal transduction histidine kinase
VLGAAVVHVRASAFSAILDQNSRGSELTHFMVDGDGVVMYHPNPDAMYRSLVPLDASVQQRIKADQRFRRDRIQSIDEPALAAGMLASKRTGAMHRTDPTSAGRTRSPVSRRCRVTTGRWWCRRRVKPSRRRCAG